MRVVVTGAAGLLGRAVAAALRSDGAEVVALDRPGTVASDGIVGVDLRDAATTDAAIPAADVLVHCAALPSLDAGPEAVVWSENLAMTGNVLLTAERRGIGTIVYASSQSALGLPTAPHVVAPDYLPVDEDHPCRPWDGYAQSKLAGEGFAAMIARRSCTGIWCLRFPVIWDPARHEQCVRRRLERPLQGAKSLWAYVDVRDAAVAVAKAAERRPERMEVVNVTAATPFADRPMDALVREFFPGVDVRSPISADTPLFDNRRAITRLGFTARYRWSPRGIATPDDPA
jgi:nucleoside-diphosphate-sugar epimerase